MSTALRLPETEVCVVGVGAVGSLVAHALTEAGHRVVGLEAGQDWSGHEVLMDELQSATVRNAWGPKFNAELPTWRLRPGGPRQRTTTHARMANGVGGSSLSYAGTSLRFHRDDFRVRSATIERYGVEAIPEGSDIADWPFSYDDLEPFYDEAEYLVGVSGRAGNLGGRIVEGGNPFEGPRRRDYPVPPLRQSGQGAMFQQAAGDLGFHPFPVPTAILSEPYEGRSACTYCSFCTRMGCHVGAKGSTSRTVVPRALETGLLDLRTGTRVTRVVVDSRGRATGVEYVVGDELYFQPASAVVLSAYSFENVRLMFLSATEKMPSGLGNDFGQLGRGYMTHQSRAVFGFFQGRRLQRFIGPYSQGFTIDDLNADNFDHTGLGFIRGGRVSMINQSTPVIDSRLLPPDTPRWGKEFKRFLVEDRDSMGYISISPEILPYANNRLDLDPSARDPYGRPVIRITFDIFENERRMMPYLQDRASELMKAMGATTAWRRQMAPIAISTHDAGGTRMGVDPHESVVDGFGQVHTVPGLFATGGSTFPTHSGMNTTLTMQAMALRTGRHIAGSLA